MSTVEFAEVAKVACPPEPAIRDVRAGFLAMVPFIVGYAPFALVIGAAVAGSTDPLAGWSGSWLIFGGSAHLAVLRSLDAGLLVAVAGGLLINARLLAYSASLAQHWRSQPRWFRIVAAAMVIDPTWAAAERHAATGASDLAQRRFFLTAGVVMGAGWSALIAVGAIAGGRLDALRLEVVVPLCLATLVAPMLRDRGGRAAVIAAASVATLGFRLPAGAVLLIAIAAGVFAGAAFPAPVEREPAS
jgi:predicted branched-subunit amino acid permease